MQVLGLVVSYRGLNDYKQSFGVVSEIVEFWYSEYKEDTIASY